MTIGTRLAIAFGVVLGALAAVSWSWTRTPIGRLDYGAAVLARVASLAGDGEEMALTPAGRDEARRLIRWTQPDWPAWPAVRVEEREIEGPGGHAISLRVYHPPDTPGARPPFYLDLHGGGWWSGDGFPFDAARRDFAAQSGAIVVSVDYRLAPEHPFPAALDDARAALRWIARAGAAFGGDPTRIAIGGESAGGNLAAALAIANRDAGGPPIAFQLLVVPATDLSGTREWQSFDEVGTGHVLTVAGLERMIEAYVPDPRARISSLASPLLEGDLSGLPPALVVTARFDPLRDQGQAYAGRLREAGVPVTLHREPGALHGFLGSPARARRVQAIAAAAVREALAAAGGAP